jgi:hypothetical protein
MTESFEETNERIAREIKAAGELRRKNPGMTLRQALDQVRGTKTETIGDVLDRAGYKQRDL